MSPAAGGHPWVEVKEVPGVILGQEAMEETKQLFLETTDTRATRQVLHTSAGP
jgi:hypothetical protein